MSAEIEIVSVVSHEKLGLGCQPSAKEYSNERPDCCRDSVITSDIQGKKPRPRPDRFFIQENEDVVSIAEERHVPQNIIRYRWTT